MAFKGYYFNKINKKYLTCKYPHCYVGTINNIITSSYWGVLNKQGISSHFSALNKKGISAYFGNNNEEENNMLHSFTKNLNQTDFYYDIRDGFNMAVEKEWHMVDPISIPTSNKTDLYDIELNKLTDSNYGIRIFYKLVLPLMYFSDSGITTNDILKSISAGFTYYNSTTFENASIGSPCITVKSGSSDLICSKGLILNKNLTSSGSYILPSSNILNNTSIPNSNFAVGATIAEGYEKYSDNNITYTLRDNSSNKNYLFMSKSMYVNESLQGFQGMQISDNTVTYSVDASAALMNTPVYSNNTANNLKFMPRLFEPFGLMLYADGYVETPKDSDHANEQQVKNVSGWIYYVLGTTTKN